MIQTYLSLFTIFSIIGFILEIIYRRINSKKWINPGFLTGPYTPIYGFGGIIIFGLFQIIQQMALTILTSGIVIFFLELITGWFFETYYDKKLWDYSDKKYHYKGWVCLDFSFYWLILISIFTFLINYFNKFQLNKYLLFTFLIIFTIDTYNSFIKNNKLF